MADKVIAKRFGLLNAGLFNVVRFPGREVRVNGEIDEDRTRPHIDFDGDASQLYYESDMFENQGSDIYVKRRRRNRDGDVQGATERVKVGEFDLPSLVNFDGNEQRSLNRMILDAIGQYGDNIKEQLQAINAIKSGNIDLIAELEDTFGNKGSKVNSELERLDEVKFDQGRTHQAIDTYGMNRDEIIIKLAEASDDTFNSAEGGFTEALRNYVTTATLDGRLENYQTTAAMTNYMDKEEMEKFLREIETIGKNSDVLQISAVRRGPDFENNFRQIIPDPEDLVRSDITTALRQNVNVQEEAYKRLAKQMRDDFNNLSNADDRVLDRVKQVAKSIGDGLEGNITDILESDNWNATNIIRDTLQAKFQEIQNTLSELDTTTGDFADIILGTDTAEPRFANRETTLSTFATQANRIEDAEGRISTNENQIAPFILSGGTYNVREAIDDLNQLQTDLNQKYVDRTNQTHLDELTAALEVNYAGYTRDQTRQILINLLEADSLVGERVTGVGFTGHVYRPGSSDPLNKNDTSYNFPRVNSQYLELYSNGDNQTATGPNTTQKSTAVIAALNNNIVRIYPEDLGLVNMEDWPWILTVQDTSMARVSASQPRIYSVILRDSGGSGSRFYEVYPYIAGGSSAATKFSFDFMLTHTYNRRDVADVIAPFAA